ncbi:hypothetical protein NAL32_06320 [Chryseobacterium sp. Ch-15]|uniref:Lipoprotein n=1 Tax=Chryseobacterium muglaense TaxID=2893752 RepID=A0A9Q3UVF3_9FLAO|nr:hypothetical protein [Chryseobacterium muglaense]MBD3904356.1 hypothetical protein [Chryseobacterium muglaense]MCC9035327.1 hypothetical protein [Chryseobacterium muglaense]MCM2554008.1 hypothetical protein [Chryseobacterium muglaense]
MKNVIFAAVILSLLTVACSKREPVIDTAQELKLKYDTTAIDSFSQGATSVDIARQIRMSSQKYQDSLKEVLKLQQEEKRIMLELEKENKKKAEAEKKLKAAENNSTEPKVE